MTKGDHVEKTEANHETPGVFPGDFDHYGNRWVDRIPGDDGRRRQIGQGGRCQRHCGSTIGGQAAGMNFMIRVIRQDRNGQAIWVLAKNRLLP